MAYSSSPFSPLLVGGVSSRKLRHFSPETEKGQFLGGASLDSWEEICPQSHTQHHSNCSDIVSAQQTVNGSLKVVKNAWKNEWHRQESPEINFSIPDNEDDNVSLRGKCSRSC